MSEITQPSDGLAPQWYPDMAIQRPGHRALVIPISLPVNTWAAFITHDLETLDNLTVDDCIDNIVKTAQTVVADWIEDHDQTTYDDEELYKKVKTALGKRLDPYLTGKAKR